MSCKYQRELAFSETPATPSLRVTVSGLPRFAGALTVAAAMLGGCSSLPTNAPTSKNIVKASQSSANTIGYKIVELDARLAAAAPQRNELGLLKMDAFADVAVPMRSDLILPGDILIVSVYEVGVSLFGGTVQAAAPGGAVGVPPSAAHNIPVTVREDGRITLPFVGAMEVGGLQPEDVAERIRARLSPFSQLPQVQVTISQTVGNAAFVTGTVAKSGRYPLTSARERLLDVIALAGGSAVDISDAELHFTRGSESATLRLADLRAEDRANIQILPGDRIEIRKRRNSITVFGATDQVSEIPFDAARLTLAEALARSTGPSDSRANARGVYLFRLERDAGGNILQPVIYRINMMNPQTYFLAQMFQMQDKDVILYANSPSNLTQKFVAMLNMLFSPALGIRYATQ